MTWRRSGPYSSFPFHCYSRAGESTPAKIVDDSRPGRVRGVRGRHEWGSRAGHRPPGGIVAGFRASFQMRSIGRLRSIFFRLVVNLGGRPEMDRESKRCPSRSRFAATQRRTDRGSTPRNSATSSVEYPSRTRWTTRNRRCSCPSGEPLSLMPESLRQLDPRGHYFPDSQTAGEKIPGVTFRPAIKRAAIGQRCFDFRRCPCWQRFW